MSTPTPKNKVFDFFKSFLMWFAVFYLIMAAYNSFFGEEPQENPVENVVQEITIELTNDDIVSGLLATFEIENKTSETVALANPCETPESLTVYQLVNGTRTAISDFSACTDKTLSGFVLAPNTKTLFTVQDFNHDLFYEAGDYFIELQLTSGETTQLVESPTLTVERPGNFRRGFRAIISKPLFNLLVFFTQTLPNHSLGLGIIFLTIIVRLILFIPNQKAMKSQRNMQKLQPKLAELKKKHGKNQQMIAMKTMELYKTHKVNPMSSCLPMLLQIPVMLGVYYIAQDGVSWNMAYLLYPFYQAVDLGNINTVFLTYDLENIPSKIFNLKQIGQTWHYLLLPLLVGVIQWFAIRMSLVRAKKKQSPAKKSAKKNPNEKPSMEEQMQGMSGAMQWAMPAMIVFFTFTFPMAVGIYWFTSTVFGIVQQKYVNAQLDKPKIRKKVN